MTTTTILVTGTLGFIGSNFIRQSVNMHPRTSLHHDVRFVGVDKAVHEHTLDNLLFHPDYTFYFGDIADAHAMSTIFRIEKPDVVINMAAESFVDDSITNIRPFIHSNVDGVQTLADQCLKHNARLVHTSTDEVYGQMFSQLGVGWVESDALNPRNPYSASKACSEHIIRAASTTHGLRYQMTRSCNVYGPRQKKLNLVPHIISSLLQGAPARIHGAGDNWRQYIYVDDFIAALWSVIEQGSENSTYNIAGLTLRTNLDMVDSIAGLMSVPANVELIEDRKGHDFGYKVDGTKLHDLGWRPQTGFDDGLRKTIDFYRQPLELSKAA